MARGVVFDLDDTLVFERDYVRSGFTHVAALCAGVAGLDAGEVFAFLWSDFEQGVRGSSFDRLRTRFEAVGRTLSLEELILAYRAHAPSLVLAPATLEVLERFTQRGTRLALVSDGPLPAQRAKVMALRLERFFAPIVLTDAWGREFWKPHARAFEHIEQAFGLRGADLVYVGDNPAKDFVAPNALGWKTVRFRVSAQLCHDDEPVSAAYAATRTIGDLRELMLDVE